MEIAGLKGRTEMESLADGAGDGNVGESLDKPSDAGRAKGANTAVAGFTGDGSGDMASVSGTAVWLGVLDGVAAGVAPISTATFSSLPLSTVTVLGSV